MESIQLNEAQPEFDCALLVKEDTSEKTIEQTEQEHKDEECKMMVQQQQVRIYLNLKKSVKYSIKQNDLPKHAHAYSGRTSMDSQQGRHYPVNSICTCSCCLEVLNDLQSSRGYKNAESPHSTHSEVRRQ